MTINSIPFNQILNISKTIFHNTLVAAAIVLLIIFPSCKPAHDIIKAGVVIHGGTSAAVIAAGEVVQSGKRVVIVSPDIHFGGCHSLRFLSKDTLNSAIPDQILTIK